MATYPTNLYQGWDPASAQADFNATGGVGKAGYTGSSNSSTPQTGADYISKSYADVVASMVKNVKPYEQVNPFSFDEALARESVTAEYAPYYAELLTDYTQDVERTKSRSAEDLQTTLEQLNSGKEYYTGVQRRALDTATRNTNEGYAGNGLFFSGVRERDVKQLQTESGATMENYMNTYKYNVGQATTGNKRTTENLDTALSQYQRENTRESKYAIEGGVLQRKNEALNEYSIKSRNYANEFGTLG